MTPDYAIFYSDKLKDGFKTSFIETEDKYILGTFYNSNDIIKNIKKKKGITGESGSPVINIDGNVIGVFGGYSTDIKIVLDKIDEIN